MTVGKVLGAMGSLLLRGKGAKIGRDLILNGWPLITLVSGASLELGDNVVLTSVSRYTALGVRHAVVIRALSGSARISIGRNVGMSGTSICAFESVTIGDDCLIGADVTISDSDFHPIDAANRRSMPIDRARHAPCIIEKNAFIGAGCYILKGVRIGENSVIGCGSVVTRDVPANVIAAGNPCRVVRQI